MDILVYITGFTAIVAVICLVMLMNLRSSVAPAQGGSAPAKAAAPARAAAPAAPAAAPAADNGAVVAAIAAAIACMEGGDVASIRLAQTNNGWTTAARIAGVQQNF